MKKSVLLLGILTFLFTSCSKTDEVQIEKETAFKNAKKKVPEFLQTYFTNSTSFTNPYFPAKRNKTYTYEGETEDGFEHIEEVRLNTFKNILGVQCIVVNFKAYVDETLIEEAFDWYAQDDAGNVWYFGEAVDNYNEDGILEDHEGSWEAGVDGAEPGIIMLAEPKNGMKYREEFYPGEAEDEAHVIGTKLTVTTPLGTFTNCIKTKNYTRLERGIIEHKYYAPNVGLIKEVNLQAHEQIFLVSIQ